MYPLLAKKEDNDFKVLDVIEEIGGLKSEEEVFLSGLKGSSPAFFISLLSKRCKRPLILIAPEADAKEVYKDISFYLNDGVSVKHDTSSLLQNNKPLFFPSLEALPFEGHSPYRDIFFQRLEVLYRLCSDNPSVLITTPKAVMQKILAKDLLLSSCERLVLKGQVERDALVENLIRRGYERVDMVEVRGELAVRGCILDIFPPLYPHPLRVELSGDELESIRTFNIDSQRTITELKEAIVLPAKGDLKTPSTLFDYISKDTLLCIKDFTLTMDEAKRFEGEVMNRHTRAKGEDSKTLNPKHRFLPYKAFVEGLKGFGRVYLEFLTPYEPKRRVFPLNIESNEDIRHEMLARHKGFIFKPLAQRVKRWVEEGFKVSFIVRSKGQSERLKYILEGYGIHAETSSAQGFFDVTVSKDDLLVNPSIFIGEVTEGFRSQALKLIVITEEEVFGQRIKRRLPGEEGKSLLSSLSEIKAGDLVVHSYHGIGIYRGLKRLKVEDDEGDYLLIEYAGGDKLYLPPHKLSLIQRYIGGEGSNPPLDRLGGVTWERTKMRVRKAVEKVAEELLKIYAARKALKGFAFSKGDRLFEEFEASFEYEETPDQRRAIEEVLRDMESKKAMDRLVCGDVGYGKTEVALRASFKAVLDSKQVAFLVPTTILAQQHYQTFKYRFAPYPVNVEVLSRFRSNKEQKDILKRLAKGEIDILIGTHRLLQDDVVFKDLGLLIIDEEQRFGVVHKEKLKRLKKLVDVLTLTATPIPRTLQMSLSGIMDISIIGTPPEDRLSIKTFILRFDKDVIKEAVLRELSRGGQVFFVHNRVNDIYRMADFLGNLLPGVRIGIAHGQMKEDALEEIMWAFLHRRYDILVTTSLIESGLDIPTVNTIIINRADQFGLTQLYQLRGRVGRSHHRAYAYLLIPEDLCLTDEGRKRLKAVEELSELGAGLSIALKDLEIRGAGEVLGTAQSGNCERVGLDMYTRLLEEAVNKLKGEEVVEETDTEMKVSLPCYLPEDYISSESERLYFYRRLASVREMKDIDMVRDEIIDRYGEIPLQGVNLIGMMELKLLGKKLGVKEIALNKKLLSLSFDVSPSKRPGEGRPLNIAPEHIVAFVNKNRNRVVFSPDQRLLISLCEDVTNPILEAKRILLDLTGHSISDTGYSLKQVSNI